MLSAERIHSHRGGYTLTGVRRAESAKRSRRKGFEIIGSTKDKTILLNDNVEDRRETEYCMQKNTYICNPIIDWSEDDVWNFIRHNNLPYCSLYDQGWTRLGCIGCPMGTIDQREEQFRRYPKYADCYKRAFQRMLDKMQEEQPTRERPWENGEDVFNWWIYGNENSKEKLQDETLFEIKDEPNL